MPAIHSKFWLGTWISKEFVNICNPTLVQFEKRRQKEERMDEFLDRSLSRILTHTHRIRYRCKSILYYIFKNKPKNVWTIFSFWIHVFTLTSEAMNTKVVTLTIKTCLREEGRWMGGEVRRAHWKEKWLLFVSATHGRED